MNTGYYRMLHSDCLSCGTTEAKFFHRYILGIDDLYEGLTSRIPQSSIWSPVRVAVDTLILGMLYYAPQGWTSDDSDAIERLKIQYGTSMCYPISLIAVLGSHVSVIPNSPGAFRNKLLHTKSKS